MYATCMLNGIIARNAIKEDTITPEGGQVYTRPCVGMERGEEIDRYRPE